MTTMRQFLGVAWPYASGPRHLGHLAGAYLPGDVVARACRLAGDEVLLISGSDQFGTPITVGAERAGVPPAAYADAHHEAIVASFAAAGISFDHYTKTATPTHARVVQDVFTRLWRAGLVDQDTQPTAYCPVHHRSLPDRYVEGTCPRCGSRSARGDQCDECGATLEVAELRGARCRECGALAQLRPQRQLVLRLDLLAEGVGEWLGRARPGWRRWVSEEAAGGLRSGLLPRAITRDLPWGVPVPLPGWDDRRLYVWFDAVIGYLSATVEWAEASGDTEGWQRWWSSAAADADLRHRYFVGKDNVWFHALWWPAIALGSGLDLRLPDEVVAAHHLTEAGAQLSASRGHGTTIDDAIARWGVDPVRHAVCSLSPETADAEITAGAIENATRTGLLGAIANPAHRVASLWWRRFGDAPALPRGVDGAQALVDEVSAAFGAASLRRGLAGVHAIGRAINQRLAATEPWRLPDDEARPILEGLVPLVDGLAVAASPVVPATAARIAANLGRPTPSSWTLPSTPGRITTPPQPPLLER